VRAVIFCGTARLLACTRAPRHAPQEGWLTWQRTWIAGDTRPVPGAGRAHDRRRLPERLPERQEAWRLPRDEVFSVATGRPEDHERQTREQAPRAGQFWSTNHAELEVSPVERLISNGILLALQ